MLIHQTEKQGLKERMLLDLEHKRRRLREERDNFDIFASGFRVFAQTPSQRTSYADGPYLTFQRLATSEALDAKARATRRNPLTKPLGDERKERRRRAQQAPQCPYLLKDSEIHEDLNVLRRVSFGRWKCYELGTWF